MEGEKEKNKINENNEKILKDLENKEEEFDKIYEENITLKTVVEKMKKDLQNLKGKNIKKDFEIFIIKNKIKEIEEKEKEENRKLKKNILKVRKNLDKEIKIKNKNKKRK